MLSAYVQIHTHVFICMCTGYIHMHIHIDIFIYIYILKRLPPLPPTSGTRGMDAWMLGCLSLCSPGGSCGSNLGCFLEALGHLWCHLGWSLQPCGSIWARLAQAGYPTEHLAFLCRREHRFEEICHVLKPESLTSLGNLWRAAAAE